MLFAAGRINRNDPGKDIVECIKMFYNSKGAMRF